MQIEKLNRIHFVGIGGIGTSGVARILAAEKKQVSGSDTGDNPLLAELRKMGARVFIGHRPENLPKNADVVVISAAIPQDNPEVRKARQLGIPVITYSQALGSLMIKRRGIAVAGTHGKTTTSSLVAWILSEAGQKPSFVIGGEIPSLGGNSGTGRGKYLVAEACEFHRNFLDLRPSSAIVTNIEEDHLDYYRNIGEIKEAFQCFLGLLPPDGFAVLCKENANLMDVAGRSTANYFTYGFSAADFLAWKIRLKPGRSYFEVSFKDKPLASLNVALAGRHNVLNSLAAFALCHRLGVEPRKIGAALAGFTGVIRRMELKGNYRGAAVIDDYGHHPSEIVATLKAVRQSHPDGRLLVVFQPHQYSRTRFFLNDFAASFALADEIIVPEIYFVRDSEESRRSVCSEDLVARLQDRGKKACFIPGFDAIVNYLKKNVRSGDTVLTIGAGPVFEVADKLLNKD